MFGRQRANRTGARAGREAFESEALSYLDGLYATALRLTRDSSQAEDLVQDAYVKAFRFADRFEPGTNLKAWLFTILHNTFRNRRRDSSRDPVRADSDALDSDMALSDTSVSPEQQLLDRTLDADLQAAFDGLPEVFREAVWLRDVEEFTYGEIARVLQVPIGTVMSRIARGRRGLYERLSAAGGRYDRLSTPARNPDLARAAKTS